MFIPSKAARLVAAMLSCAVTSGCSVALEATRPDPVNLSSVPTGTDRLQVVGKLGAPVSTVKNGDQSCDVFSVYTRGPGAGGKAAIAAGEAVADVFTLGLSEVLFTPVEAGTRNEKHNVTACYDGNMKLVSLQDNGVPVPPPGTTTADASKQNPAPKDR
jgi:hypothetical protein